jgi:hypothetical protein
VVVSFDKKGAALKTRVVAGRSRTVFLAPLLSLIHDGIWAYRNTIAQNIFRGSGNASSVAVITAHMPSFRN